MVKPKIHPRSAWGAKSREGENVKYELIVKRYIMLHHTTDNHIQPDYEAARRIQNKGFKSEYGDIAYNYLIGKKERLWKAEEWI